MRRVKFISKKRNFYWIIYIINFLFALNCGSIIHIRFLIYCKLVLLTKPETEHVPRNYRLLEFMYSKLYVLFSPALFFYILGSALLTCPNCKKTYNKPNSFYKHTKLDCGRQKFSCIVKECRYQSTRKENIRRHIQQVHAVTLESIWLYLGNVLSCLSYK